MIVKNETVREKNTRVAEVLPLFPCFVSRVTEGVELAILHYVALLATSGGAVKGLSYIRLTYATADRREKKTPVSTSAEENASSIADKWLSLVCI